MLRYELSFVQLVAWGTGGALLLSSQVTANWAAQGLLFVFFWLCVVGGNYLLRRRDFSLYCAGPLPLLTTEQYL